MEIETKTKFTIKTRIQSFIYALRGIIYAFKRERSIWLQSLAAILTVILGIVLHVRANEWGCYYTLHWYSICL